MMIGSNASPSYKSLPTEEGGSIPRPPVYRDVPVHTPAVRAHPMHRTGLGADHAYRRGQLITTTLVLFLLTGAVIMGVMVGRASVQSSQREVLGDYANGGQRAPPPVGKDEHEETSNNGGDLWDTNKLYNQFFTTENSDLSEEDWWNTVNYYSTERSVTELPPKYETSTSYHLRSSVPPIEIRKTTTYQPDITIRVDTTKIVTTTSKTDTIPDEVVKVTTQTVNIPAKVVTSSPEIATVPPKNVSTFSEEKLHVTTQPPNSLVVTDFYDDYSEDRNRESYVTEMTLVDYMVVMQKRVPVAVVLSLLVLLVLLTVAMLGAIIWMVKRKTTASRRREHVRRAIDDLRDHDKSSLLNSDDEV